MQTKLSAREECTNAQAKKQGGKIIKVLQTPFAAEKKVKLFCCCFYIQLPKWLNISAMQTLVCWFWKERTSTLIKDAKTHFTCDTSLLFTLITGFQNISFYVFRVNQDRQGDVGDDKLYIYLYTYNILLILLTKFLISGFSASWNFKN